MEQIVSDATLEEIPEGFVRCESRCSEPGCLGLIPIGQEKRAGGPYIVCSKREYLWRSMEED